MKSHISAVALSAALLTAPHLALAQGLDLGVNVGGDSGINVDAGVDVENGLDIGADVGIGESNDNVVDLDIGGTSDGGSDSSNSLVDVDLGVGGGSSGSGAGPNGGTLIDLGGDLLDADVNLLNGSSGGSNNLVNGDIRIAALDGTARADAMLELIENPNLADIDLDASVDDRAVSIVSAADLFDEAALADIELAVNAGGEGRTELLDALSASVELGTILESEGVDLSDVLAVQVAENGATEVIVLDRPVEVAALGDDGDLADATVEDLAELDVDLLSDEELAEIDLALLPEDARSRAVVRLLESSETPQPGALPQGELVTIDLGAITDDTAIADVDAALTTGEDDLPELTADIDLLDRLDEAGIAPEAVAALRIGADDDLLVFVDSGVDDTLTASIGAGDADDGTGTGGSADDGSDGGSSDEGDTGTDASAGNDDGNGAGGGSDAGTGGSGTSTGVAAAGSVVGTLPATRVGAGFSIAALSCETGILAMANGSDASPQAIASADSLELVRVEGCARSLVDADIGIIHDAIDANPAISSTLEGAGIPLDQVIGATVQGDTVTLFLDRTVS